MKFLHISDVHLGCTRYQLEESPRDFFDAWRDVLEKYAVGEQVDFVIMGGDFFHKRSVPPETMNYAVAGLRYLRKHDIPIITIEGNHDQKYNDNDHSWLRSLSKWNLLHLIEPTVKEDSIFYEPWNDEFRRGGFVDIGRARIFGSNWYGASGNQIMPRLINAIRDNHRPGAFHILLLHTDVEGHQTHPIPSLTMENLQKLKEVTDYVALGHTHKCYAIDNWAFNPGSLEITKIDEFRETRGAWLIEVDGNNDINAHHTTDYRQRPFQRLGYDVTGMESTEAVTAGVMTMAERQARKAEESKPAPIIEVTLRGQLGFPGSLLELQKIRMQIKKDTSALHVILKNQTVPVGYDVPEDVSGSAEISRDQIERKVFETVAFADTRFKKNIVSSTEMIIGAKRMALLDDNPEQIAEFIGKMLDTPDEEFGGGKQI